MTKITTNIALYSKITTNIALYSKITTNIALYSSIINDIYGPFKTNKHNVLALTS